MRKMKLCDTNQDLLHSENFICWKNNTYINYTSDPNNNLGPTMGRYTYRQVLEKYSYSVISLCLNEINKV